MDYNLLFLYQTPMYLSVTRDPERRIRIRIQEWICRRRATSDIPNILFYFILTISFESDLA